MFSSNLDSLTPVQRLILEPAFVPAKELGSAAGAAPEGQVIDQCEPVLPGNARHALRRVLESTLQSRVEAAEKNPAPPAVVPVGRQDGTRGTRPEP